MNVLDPTERAPIGREQAGGRSSTDKPGRVVLDGANCRPEKWANARDAAEIIGVSDESQGHCPRARDEAGDHACFGGLAPAPRPMVDPLEHENVIHAAPEKTAGEAGEGVVENSALPAD